MSTGAGAVNGTNDSQTETTTGCSDCNNAKYKYELVNSSQNLFLIHTSRAVVTCNKKNPDYITKNVTKKNDLQKIEKVVAALRNTQGGEIIVHLDGQRGQDKYLEYFDEWISQRLENLLEDGQRYVDTYVRMWMSDIVGLESFTDFLCIKVKKSDRLVTVDYNTKLSNDIEKLRPSSEQIKSLIIKTTSDARGPPLTNPRNVDPQCLHESRYRELKFFDSERINADLAQYIWKDLKFKDNLTSMSKVPGGGSYYVGILERESRDGNYKTKVPEIVGFELPIPKEELFSSIKEKIRSEVCVLKDKIFCETPEREELIKQKLYLVPNSDQTPQKYVLEIAVRHFDGIVFYDQGPRTYKIVDGIVRRMDKNEWISRFMSGVKVTNGN